MTGGVAARSFQAGAAHVAVICPDDDAAVLVDRLFVDLPTSGDPTATITITPVEEGEGAFELRAPGWTTRVYDIEAALATLVTIVNRLALDAEPERLHIHAAGLADPERRGVVICAASGTGKSTLATALATDGWSYLSDETVAIDDDGSVTGFPKPLVLKHGGRGLFPELVEHSVTAGDNRSMLLPASVTGASTVDALKVQAVVLLTPGDPATPVEVRPIHRCDAVAAMLSQTMDADRRGSATLPSLARVAAAATCVEVAVGPLAEERAAVAAILDAPGGHCELTILTAGNVPASTGSAVRQDVVSVEIDGRVAVHRPETGAMAAFDEAGSHLWRALANGDEAEIRAVPSAAAFVATLAQAGLLMAT